MTVRGRGYRIERFPRSRRIIVDGGRMAAQRHTVHALLEVDVTVTRQAIRACRATTGRGLSMSAYVIWCVARAVAEHPEVQAYRDWRSRVIVFDDVDINTSIETELAGQRIPVAHILRRVNRRTPSSIHAELESARKRGPRTGEASVFELFGWLPGISRRIFYRFVFADPRLLRVAFGTVGVTAVGMFGRGAAWAIPFGLHSLSVAVGTVSEEPRYVRGVLEPREILHVTLTADHDVIDGAPLARFARRLGELIERAEGLDA
jgi:pyruvate/2-oxoglutarate dehydrogenase complex dihydrolipoamide acyltransferase (E2) component